MLATRFIIFNYYSVFVFACPFNILFNRETEREFSTVTVEYNWFFILFKRIGTGFTIFVICLLKST